MQIEILVDAGEFWPRLKEDIRTARERVYLQALSFEGDRVGEEVAGALSACTAADRRVIADDFYTKHRINDNFLHNPKHWFERHLWRERDATLAMMRGLEQRRRPNGPSL